LLAVAFFCAVTPANGVITQGVPLLTDHGLSAEEAASVLGILGVAIVCSRLVSGYLVDRIHAPLVTAALFSLSLIGIPLLVGGAVGRNAAIGVALCGMAIGCEVDLMGFLITRYFGLRAFGVIYGYIFMVIPIGVGTGSLVMGIAYDHAHSYEPALLLFIPMVILACVLLLMLGPYRYPRQPEVEPALGPIQSEATSLH
jgi:predicted MFS family arabinose efflux permease